jgi:amino acid adenylation domain-containing protein/non-ribosomal peptide synthase protein (TIGR01720 family)
MLIENKFVHKSFEGHANKWPDRLAVKDDSFQITYGELNRSANRLAHLLKKFGVGKNHIVNVLIPPGVQLVVSMLAAFKVNGIYLPMDLNFSSKRFRQITKETFHGVMIVSEDLFDAAEKLIREVRMPVHYVVLLDKAGNTSVATYDKDFQRDITVISAGDYSDITPETIASPEDSNYIFYTSGSTGDGKAIVGCHKSLSNYIAWAIKEFSIDHTFRIGHLSQSTFDASLKDILMALCSGGTLHIPPTGAKDNVIKLLEWIEREEISVIQCVPSVFRLMLGTLESGANQFTFRSLKHIMLDGEVLYAKDVMRWRATVGDHVELINLYGTTETTILSTFHRIKEIPQDPSQILHVGNPIDNTFIIICNNGNLCRIGEIGEVYIKSPYISKGYYNNRELTAAHFVQNPLERGRKDIVYKTGDQGRYVEGRLVEILGRKDKQIKLNGIRLELGEIEKAVLGIDGVKEVVVTVQEAGDSQKQLLCYYTGARGVTPAILAAEAKKALNASVVPRYFIQLDKFPLNINGKIDKKALPLPEASIDESKFEPCQNDVELRLEAIWTEILGDKPIGRNASFFDLGGQSLKAMQLVTRVYQHFEVEMSLKDVFTHPRIKDLAALVSQTNSKNYQPIGPVPSQEYYQASNAQQRLWVLSQSPEGNIAYNISSAFVFKGDLNRNALEESFQTLIERHESLRTSLVLVDGVLQQKIHAPSTSLFQLGYTDLRNTPDKRANAAALSHRASQTPFDLERDILFRASLLHLEDDEYVLLITLHHTVSDGWSMRVLIKETLLLYNAYAAGKQNPLPALRIQYKDYTAWQNAALSGEAFRKLDDYWVNKFQNGVTVLSLPTDHPRPAIRTHNGERINFLLSPETKARLRNLQAKKNVTLFMILQAAVKALMHRYTGQQDITVGTTIANRDHRDLENQIGFYVNTLALQTILGDQENFDSLLEKVRTETLEAYDHKHYPFERLVDALSTERDLSRTPIFQVLVELLNVDVELESGKTKDMHMIDSGSFFVERTISKYDLTFSFSELEKGITLSIEYNTDLFRRSRIEKMFNHFDTLLNACLDDVSLPINSLQYLPNEERQLLASFNKTGLSYPASPYARLFEEQVRRTPGAVAVDFEKHLLTYEQLNKQSNQLAHCLMSAYGMKRGDIVGLMNERSDRTIIAMLAILKCGAAFLPIDVSNPGERAADVLRDAGVSLVLTDSRWMFDLQEGFQGNIFALDIQLPGLSAPDTDLQLDGGGGDFAYVIYTSGSTGKPKGVAVTNANLVNYVLWANTYYFENGIGHSFAFATSVSFDLTVTSIFTTLLRGDKIFVVPNKDIDELLCEIFDENSTISTVKLTPSHLSVLGHLPVTKTAVSKAILGGEVLVEEHVRILKKLNPQIRIYNEYGPTETTVGCMIKEVQTAEDLLSIGRPISNTKVFVVDANRHLLPIGYVGEIAIAGRGVAPGYVNRPELTADKFVARDASPDKEPIYLTGDLGFWNEDGEIVFLGRKDSQVKLRGYRIELTEIAQAIMQHSDVALAVAVLRQDTSGNDHIVAYVTRKTNAATDLRSFLTGRLPNYMIPSYFVTVEKFPLTANGKIDHAALPEPTNLGANEEYVTPRTLLEKQLASIWEAVLDKAPVSVRDNFFELGGHSLKATQAIAQIQRQLHIKIQLRDIFDHPILEDLAEVLSAGAQPDHDQISFVGSREFYDCSHSQRRLWIIDQLENHEAIYNIPAAYLVRGILDRQALETAFTELVNRHESLRTSFRVIDGEPKQKINTLESLDSLFLYEDFSQVANYEGRLKEVAAEESTAGFDLEKGPLVRMRLIQFQDQDYLLLFTMHHIISDGWSNEVAIRELMAFYRAYTEGVEPGLAPLTIQYKDFSAWQNDKLESADHHKQYWLAQLKGELPRLQLPMDFPRPVTKTYNGDKVYHLLGREATDQVRLLNRREGVTTFMTLLTVVKTLLSRYTRQSDIIIGTPVSGRDHAALENQIGFYANTLVLRTVLDEDETFASLLGKVKRNVLMAHEHQLYPFDMLVEDLKVTRDLDRAPVFDVMVVHQQRSSVADSFTSDLLTVSAFPTTSTVSKFDLTFICNEFEEDISITVEYNTDLFKRDRIERMQSHIVELLKRMTDNVKAAVYTVDFIPQQEKQLLLEKFNSTAAPFPFDRTIGQMFEEQAGRTPDAIALRTAQGEMTYAELNRMANKVAYSLRSRDGVRPDTPVGLMVGRSYHMIVGILAILKAGGAYVPVDPAYPRERKLYIIENSGINILLTDFAESGTLDFFKGTVYVMDRDVDLLENYTNDLPSVNTPRDLAYIIYTSGSTGKPKGVMIEHRSNINMALDQIKQFSVTPSDNVLQFASLSFDASVYEIFMAFYSGASLVLVSDEIIKDPYRFTEYCRSKQVTIATLPPSYLSSLPLDQIKFLRVIITAGEAAHVSDAVYCSQFCDYYNAYGPTECAVCVSVNKVTQKEEGYTNIPIGYPIANTHLHVIDRHHALVPIGVPGEISVAGVGLARGYYNQEELTGLAFVDNPFDKNISKKLYKTGDIGRWLPDGRLEVMGRIDDQVKVRGFRIELGEIIHVLNSHEQVQEAYVNVIRDHNDNVSLVAYLVSHKHLNRKQRGQFEHAIRGFCLSALPAYMIPSYFITLDKLPLTPNGKVDKKALPAPGDKGQQLAQVEPTTEKEKLLVKIWQAVLGKDRIGITDNFFLNGGDSIKAIQVASRVHQAGYRLEARNLFRFPIIEQLAISLTSLQQVIDQSVITGPVSLTPIQEDFFATDKTDQHHFNQSVMFFSAEGFDVPALKRSISEVTRHHDVLRTTFSNNNGVIQQVIRDPEYGISLEIVDLTTYEDALPVMKKMADEKQSGLRLETGPLFRPVLFRLSDGDRLLLIAHHLIMDTVSWRILFEDIGTLYVQQRDGRDVALPLKTTSYKDWSEAIRKMANSEKLLAEKKFWKQIEATKGPAIPTDYKQGSNLISDTKTFSFKLNEKKTRALLSTVNKAFNTEINDILLTALGLCIKRAFGLETVVVGLESHGREDLVQDVDITRTVGWFTSVYPIVLDVRNEYTLARQIVEVKEALHRVPGRGIGYGILRYVTDPANTQDLRFDIHPDVAFNYLGQFDQDIERSSFSVAAESGGSPVSGNRKRKYPLEISGITAGSKLQIVISYSGKQFKAKTIRNVAKLFQESLIEVIEFCRQREETIVTPSDLTCNKISIDKLEALKADYLIEDIYPLSYMQAGLFFHALMSPSSSAYTEQVAYAINGNIDVPLLRESINKLFQRHAVLRAAFVMEGLEEPLQIIVKDRQAGFYFEDISTRSESERRQYVEAFKEKDKAQSFNVAKDPLMRISILRTGPAAYEYIWSFHHILIDGWCFSILIAEFFEIYNSLLHNRPAKLSLIKPYKNYIHWLFSQDKAEAKKYWAQYLSGYDSLAGIPRSQSVKKAYQQNEFMFSFSPEKTTRLKELVKQERVTINAVIQSIWAVLLAKYSGKQDVVFGEVVSGRPAEIEGIESMIGLFLNTIPVRIAFQADTTFDQLVASVHEQTSAKQPYHYYPLSDILNENSLKQNLFDHIIALSNFPVTRRVADHHHGHNKSEFEISDVEIFEQTTYDLHINVGIAEQLVIKFNFNSGVYDGKVLENLLEHFRSLVDQVIDDIHKPVTEYGLLTAYEQEVVLQELNDTQTDFPSEKSIQQLFEEAVDKSPMAPAVVSGGKVFTYRELNENANRLAHYLRERYAIRPDDRIGLMVGRSELMLIGILGILKSGAGYVPIDPDYPEERKQHMLADASVKVLITEGDLVLNISEFYNGDLFTLDVEFGSLPLVTTNPVRVNHGQDIAYVMYTSGSTGNPKGVVIEHKSVVRLVKDTNYANIQPHDRILQLSNYAFDGSVFDIFGALLNGAALYLIDKQSLLSNKKLVEFIDASGVNTLFITTALFNNLVEMSPACIRNFDKIYFGGEEASLLHIRKALENRKSPDSLVHVYGPTESTTFATYYVIESVPDESLSIPIGKPISNTKAYVLDAEMKPVPMGVMGELYLGGDGLARGYLQQPLLTREKFVKVRNGDVEEVLYRTGDLAKISPDGNIEFKGRKDTQVKIRGHRIELGEIENVLLKFPAMEQVFITAHTTAEGDKQLLAYYVTRQDPELNAIRSFMEGHLPGYMIPAFFIPMQTFPLSMNGKVDVKALPLPGDSELKSKGYVAPTGLLQQELAKIWSTILGVEKIGIQDNFFTTGGDSIKAIRLVSAINKEINQTIEIKDVFNCPDIESLSHYIEELKQSIQDERRSSFSKAIESIGKVRDDIISNPEYAAMLPEDWEDILPMSDIQKGMLYYTLLDKTSAIYHDQIYYQIEDKAFDFRAFRSAFEILVRKHELLRTSFHMDRFPEAVQIIHRAGQQPMPITIKDISYLNVTAARQYIKDTLAEDRENPFDMQQPGLWRVIVLKLSSDQIGILFVIHHAIIDGWSEASLKTELSNIYYTLKENRLYELRPLKASYKDYMIDQLQAKWSQSTAEFWRKELNGYERTSVPLHKSINRQSVKISARHAIRVDNELDTALYALADKMQVSIKDVYLAAFLYLVKLTTASDDITIGLVTNGRPAVEDGDKIIGCFLNTVPVRMRIAYPLHSEDFIRLVGDKTKAVKNHDKLSLQDIVKVIGEETSIGNPIFDSIFNYLDLHIISDSHENTKTTQSAINSYVNTNTFFDFTVEKVGRSHTVNLVYSSDLYSEKEVQRLAEYYKGILSGLVKRNTVLKPGDLIADELENVLRTINNTASAYPDKTVHELVEVQAERFGDLPAVICEDIVLTYDELNRKANQLAHYLREHLDIGHDDVIGIVAGRSEKMIVGLLGILKAGAAYVPIDAELPTERLRIILEDVSPKAVLFDAADTLSGMDDIKWPAIISLQAMWNSLEEYASENPAIVNSATDLAYVMYTSGSTGKPKGVMIEHRSIVRLVSKTNYVRIGNGTRLLQTASLSFDAATFEIWGMLLNGGELHLLPYEKLSDHRALKEKMVTAGINMAWFTSSWFNELVDADLSIFSELHHLLVGGDKLSPHHIARLKACYPGIKITNGYGPTENTTFSLCYTIDKHYETSIPIGAPISNSTVFVLDKNLQPVPLGVIGEIFVGGDGIARGYWKNRSLTNDRFIPDPFNAGRRLYRTGDLGRLTDEGVVEFEGRADSQIKIRGYRIELEEIESIILKHHAIQNCHVLVRSDKAGEKYIVGYCTLKHMLEPAQLRTFLADYLPSYMIPAYMIFVDSFELTANGKLNVNALPDPQQSEGESVVVSPRNETEEILCGIWREVLKREHIGVLDNFFELGGHSLKATRMLSYIHKTFDVEIELRKLFANPTVEGLALEVAALKWADNALAATSENYQDIIL